MGSIIRTAASMLKVNGYYRTNRVLGFMGHEADHVFISKNELVIVLELVQRDDDEFYYGRFSYFLCERVRTGERFRVGVEDRAKNEAFQPVHPLMMLAMQAEE